MSKKTKPAVCVVCGVNFEASVFASLKTCRCDDCKGSKKPKTTIEDVAKGLARQCEPKAPVVVDVTTPQQAEYGIKEVEQVSAPKQTTAYGEKLSGPRIDGQPNKALARLACPHHPHKMMKVIGVIKSGWGDMVDLQCQECYTRVQITDRPKNGYPVQTTACGTDFEPIEIISALDEGNIADKASK